MVKAVVFDAYGTLFDVHSVMSTAEQLFPGKGQQISEIWRQKQLEYTWLRSLMKKYADFEKVNRDALTYTLQSFHLSYDDASLNELLNSYLQLQMYPEVKQALQDFRPRQLVILSNGTAHMLNALVKSSGLQNSLDGIISVDELGTYKPDPSVYQLAVAKLKVPKDETLFVSSNGWDAAGSKAFGFQVGWINRTGKTREELDVPPDYEVSNLSELVRLTTE